MTFSSLEQIFNRAWKFTFTRKKFLFVFPILLVCGLLIVFCRTLSYEANRWIVLSLAFLPVFLSSGVLLATGVMLSRMYTNEVRGNEFEFRKLLGQSLEVLVGVSYLSLPLILSYLCLWTVMGIFYLLKEIPSIGNVISVLFSFGPFLLVCGSLALSIFCLLLLFFVTPQIALRKGLGFQVAKEIYQHVASSWFSNTGLFLLGSLPTLFIVGFLSLAAVMTGVNYTVPSDVLSVSLQWFFIMVPYCAILAPTVIFFFNFATESYVFMRKKNIGNEQSEAPVKDLEKEECVSQS